MRSHRKYRQEKGQGSLRKFFKTLDLKDAGLSDGLGKASVIGLHLVSGMLVGGVIGYFLDEWLDTSPWMKIIFFFLGIGAGFRNVWLDTKLLLKAQATDQPEGESASEAISEQDKTEN